MSDRRRLVYSILKFCSAEMQSNQLSDDAKESLEVNFRFRNFLAFYLLISVLLIHLITYFLSQKFISNKFMYFWIFGFNFHSEKVFSP